MCASENQRKREKKWTGNEHGNAAGNNSWFYMGIKNKWSNFPLDKVTLKMSAVIACGLAPWKELSIMGNAQAELSLTSEAHRSVLNLVVEVKTHLAGIEQRFGEYGWFVNEENQVFSDLHLKATVHLPSPVEKYQSHGRKGQAFIFLPWGLEFLYSCVPSQRVSKCQRWGAPTPEQLLWPYWAS